MNWYLAVIRQYVAFGGRAHRTEYWMFTLFNVLIMIGLGLVGELVGVKELLGNIYSLAVLLPSLGVSVRRLHDTNRSGWWLLILLIPLLGLLVYLYFMISNGDQGSNRFGDDPKNRPDPV